jgi:hypothetical protein
VLATRDDGLTLLLNRVRPGHNLRGADAYEIVQTLGALCPRVHLPVTPGRFRPTGEGSQALSWRRALAGTRELDELERLPTPARGDRLLAWIRIRAVAIAGEAGGAGSGDTWTERLLRLADALT